MFITPIKTKLLMPPRDDLFEAMQKSLKRVPERSVVVITSKVVSIGEGRCVAYDTVADKDRLIMHEADFYLPRRKKMSWVMHTIKHNLFIPTAGIDESNGNGYYILWPKNPKASARKIHAWICNTYRVKECGVLITDSHSIPLRRGVIGISLAHYGFAPLNDYRGKKDLFGRDFHVSQTNVADGLAAAAVLAMGEGAEQTPLALVTDVSFIKFVKKLIRSYKRFSSFEVPIAEDLYAPFFSYIKWRKGAGGRA